MHVAVLGATGRTGVPLVEDALARGHHVRVLVRDRGKAQRLLPVADARLEAIEGDAVARDAVERVVAGTDAVFDVTGPVTDGPKDLRRQVTGALLPAMEQHGVRRLLLLTGAGVRVDGDRPTLADRAVRGVMQRLQPAVLADGQAAVAAVIGSPLEWTVVRVPRLREAELRGQVRVGAHLGGDTGMTLGRADLAVFLLDALEDPAWSRQALVVSW